MARWGSASEEAKASVRVKRPRSRQYLSDGDLEAALEDIPTPPAKARVLVDHYSSLADRFVAEFEAGFLSNDAVRALHDLS
ncbi:hypothetical protein GS940_02005 [Rhodococcus hoagii]|nr:hypothetical protein [Prescottella equi]